MDDDSKNNETPIDPFEPDGNGIPIHETKTKFHGKEEKDYLGRSWVIPPSDVKPVDNPHCFLPKKCIHKWYLTSSFSYSIGLVIQKLFTVLNSSLSMVICYSQAVVIIKY